MGDVVIRPASEGDVMSIAQLQGQWSNEGITWGLVPDTPDGIRGHLGRYCYVAELRGDVIGYATGQVLPDPERAALPAGKPCLEITDLYVAPSFRSHGIGSSLLDSLLGCAKAAGVTSFLLSSGTKDIARTVSFYERHGFTVVGVEMVSTPG